MIKHDLDHFPVTLNPFNNVLVALFFFTELSIQRL
jgi:hypothetical protein